MNEKFLADRVQGLEAIKQKALDLADEGQDAFEVRDFITDAKKALALANPDTESMQRAVDASKRFKTMTFADKTEKPI
jgi:hypothetical protein